MASNENLDRWDEEFKQVKELRKKNRFNFHKTTKIVKRVLPKYKKIMEKHLGKYRDQFSEYFKRHSKEVLAFDIEEYYNEIICILTLSVNSDSRYLIHIDIFNDWPKGPQSDKIRKKYKKWLEKQKPSKVVIHGTNQNELKLLEDSKHEPVNTQEMLEDSCIQNELGNERTGLDAFEECIGFERAGCKFLKHNKNLPNSVGGNFIRYFFDLSLVSIHYHLYKKPQRKCWKCGKLQDVLLYCLEDSFTTLLAYVMCDNILAEKS